MVTFGAGSAASVLNEHDLIGKNTVSDFPPDMFMPIRLLDAGRKLRPLS
jgi:hypothetical protein